MCAWGSWGECGGRGWVWQLERTWAVCAWVGVSGVVRTDSVCVSELACVCVCVCMHGVCVCMGVYADIYIYILK